MSFEVAGKALAASTDKVDDKPEAATRDTAGDARPSHKWAPIRTQSALLRGYRPLFAEAWFPLALAAPLLLWLAVVCSALVRRRLAARAASGTGRALREAQQRLAAAEAAAKAGDAARFHAEASAALLGVLGARLGEPLVGLTRSQLRELLAARSVPHELTTELLNALERSEFARFSSAQVDPGQLAAELANLRTLWKRLGALGLGAQEVPSS